MIGKKNMVFGFFYFITTLGLGMYLAKIHNVPGITDAQKGIMRRRTPTATWSRF